MGKTFRRNDDNSYKFRKKKKDAKTPRRDKRTYLEDSATAPYSYEDRQDNA